MRDSSARPLATIPDRFTPDFVERLDRRTAIAKAVVSRIQEIEQDAGGRESLSYARRSLIRRCVWLEATIENAEQRLAAGEGIDLGSHTQSINALLGLFRTLGLERRSKPVRSLRDIMGSASP
jgi:hypothetical protein